MSDEPTSSGGHPARGDGGHLDDEAVSAALDGEATVAEVAHLDSCDVCRARVARVRRVQALVAVPPALGPTDRERAVGAALEAFDLAATGARPSDETGDLAATRRRRSRPAFDRGPWLGVAAVVLLIALAVPLLAGLGSGDDDGDEAATDDVAGDSGGEGVAEGPESQASTSAPAPPVDVGDLGPLAAGADLRPVVDGALGPPDEDAAAAGAGSDQESEAGPASESPPTTTAGEPGDDGSTGSSYESSQVCEATVRADLPDAGALLLVGTATVDDQPAAVYGFAAPTASPTVLVALVTIDGCRLVTFQSHARG